MIYKGARAVIQSGAQLGTSQKYADASARKAQDVRRTRESAATAKERAAAVEQAIQESGLRGDDGVPPGYPTVTAEAFFHQVDLYWPTPPASDEVVGSLVRIRPEDESSRIVSRPSHSATIKNLPHKPHTFEVLLFDKWGRESLWSDAVTATPMLTAAEEIDLSEIAMLGRLRGLLPNTNLATIEDATKLADELIESGKIAPGAITGPKLPDGVVTGPKIADEAITGPKIPNDAITGPKIAIGEIDEARLAGGSVTETKIAPDSVTSPKILAGAVETGKLAAGSVTAGKILAGAVETEKLAATAVTAQKLAAGSVVADKIGANAVTTVKLDAGAVNADKIAAGSVTTPKIYAGAVDADKIAANAVIAEKILADAIQTRHITAGAVTASVMAAQDAAAFNLWAQNAMIRSAAVQSLAADKITAGEMTAGQITLAGAGRVKAGNIILDSGGITMPYLNDFFYLDTNQNYKITAPNGRAGMYFVRVENTDGGANSAVLQGSSDSQARGMAYLAAIHNPEDFTAWGNATLRVLGYRPADQSKSYVEARAAQVDLDARDWIALRGEEIRLSGRLIPQWTGAGGDAPAGGWVQWDHNLGRFTNLAMAFQFISDHGGFRPITNGSTFLVDFVNRNRIRVTNNSNSRHTFLAVIF